MPHNPTPTLELPHGLAFAELYSTGGAARIDALFMAHLQTTDTALATRLAAARASPDALERKAESELLIALGPHLEDFLAAIFGIETHLRALQAKHHALAPLYAVKRLFVQRKAMNTYRADVAAMFDGCALRRDLESALGVPFGEVSFANAVVGWQQDESANAAALAYRAHLLERGLAPATVNRRLAALHAGDPVRFRKDGPRIAVEAGDGPIAMLSGPASVRWAARLDRIVSAKLIGTMERQAAQSPPTWRAALRCDRWTIPVVEAVLAAPIEDERPQPPSPG
jgi:hypothetical protein